MFVKLIIIYSAVTFLAIYANKCYICNSEQPKQENCKDPFKKADIPTTECPVGSVCTKLKQNAIVQRSCMPAQIADVILKNATNYTFATCTGDLCNSASYTSVSPIIVLGATAIYFMSHN